MTRKIGAADRDADAVALLRDRLYHVAAEKSRATENRDQLVHIGLRCHRRLPCPNGAQAGAEIASMSRPTGLLAPDHVVTVRANMWSILVAMMKSFSCSPLIFLVCKETVALPQPKLIFG